MRQSISAAHRGVQGSVPRITVYRSAQEMEKLRPLWKFIQERRPGTIFQEFDWNLLAARAFQGREAPFVVCVEGSYGAAIVPAVQRSDPDEFRLLGEELFDYRGFLWMGDKEILRTALARLGQEQRPLEIIAVRECDLPAAQKEAAPEEFAAIPFSAAPCVTCKDISADEFASAHHRLGRNLRRLQRLGFEARIHTAENLELLRTIYEKKAGQDPASLFHDPRRVEFLARAARLQPQRCEVFTLECGSDLAAALVTFRDGAARRFYTGWFDPSLAKHSPALSLIYEATRRSLNDGLDCDYMTGEQPYKLRIATGSMPLYRLRATRGQLSAMDDKSALRMAG